jgi:hypothetical protein
MGIVGTVINELKQYEIDGKLDTKALRTINAKTNLGKFVAEYLKEVSGTAVAEAEYRRILNLLSGSDWKNLSSAREKITSFVGALDRTFRTNVSVNFRTVPDLALALVKDYRDSFGVETTKSSFDDETNSNYGAGNGNTNTGTKTTSIADDIANGVEREVKVEEIRKIPNYGKKVKGAKYNIGDVIKAKGKDGAVRLYVIVNDKGDLYPYGGNNK